MDALIFAEKVCKTYNPERPDAFQAVAEVDLTVKTGEVLVLKGPSGSGKTSLLSLLGCMVRPTSGRVVVEGHEVSRLPERFLTQVRRKTFGFVFQQFHLIRNLSVLENVMLPLYPGPESFTAMQRRGQTLLDRFELGDKASRRISELSGGEQQRVAIARALANSPRVVIADEPTAHLDSRLAQEFLTMLADLNRQGTTLLIASHDPAVFNHPGVDRVVTMQDGRVLSRNDP